MQINLHMHDDSFIPLDDSSPSNSTYPSSNSPTCMSNNDEFDWDDLPLWALQGSPLYLNFDSSDADDPLRESMGKNNLLFNPNVSSISVDVDEINLHNSKILSHRLTT